MLDSKQKNIEHTYRDQLSTVDDTGKRVWVYPKKVNGKWFLRRKVLGYLLLSFFIAAPFLKVGGHQMLLLDVINRRFIMFGSVFWPHDFIIFVVGLITFFVFIFLFTSVFGRLFCGWACSHTIFLEFIFRRIEYFIEGDATKQRKLDAMPWNREKIIKKGFKHLLFYAVSFIIANIFLAYIIGSEELRKIVTENPKYHLGGLLSIIVFSGVFYFVFSYLREQVCTVICPYGRLQSVLVDDRTLTVAYNYKRGEPRTKWSRNRDSSKGDCIDCGQCVSVCPTGIDIRNGIQLECVNCTLCIDACDSVMTKIGKPKNLISFASMQGIERNEHFRMTTRRILYSALLAVLVGTLITILMLRSDVQATILRTPGMEAIETPDGTIKNIYNIKVLNKTFNPMPIELRLESVKGKVTVVGDPIVVGGDEYKDGIISIEIKKNLLASSNTPIRIGIFSNGKKVESVKTTFMSNQL